MSPKLSWLFLGLLGWDVFVLRWFSEKFFIAKILGDTGLVIKKKYSPRCSFSFSFLKFAKLITLVKLSSSCPWNKQIKTKWWTREVNHSSNGGIGRESTKHGRGKSMYYTKLIVKALNVSNRTMWKILKLQCFYSYHSQRVQSLIPADFSLRIANCFCICKSVYWRWFCLAMNQIFQEIRSFHINNVIMRKIHMRYLNGVFNNNFH